MRKLSGYGPSVIVLVTAMLVLYLGPRAVEEITYKQTEARMIQASNQPGFPPKPFDAAGFGQQSGPEFL